MRNALYSSGRCSRSNSASITGPMTWTTLPTFCFGSPAGFFGASLVRVAMCIPLAFQRFRAPHDLRELLGDLGLARAVVGAPQRVEYLARVVRRVLHRGPLRTQEPRRRLDQRPVHLVPNVQR